MKLKLLSFALLLTLPLSAQCWESFDPGYNHSTAINTDGRIRTIGYNAYGQIGDGTNIEKHVFTLAGDAVYVAVSGGGNHTMGLRADGTLWTWGRNVQGELGIGASGNRNVPTQVGTDNTWTKIWAGSFNSFAQKSDGSLWSWGLNYYGQLGHPGTGVMQVGTDTDWVDLSPTPNATYGIKSNGTMWGWYASTSTTGATAVQIETDSDWVMVRGGDEHVIALKSDGSIWTWGSNDSGQLGNPVPNPTGSYIRRVGTDNDWTMVAAGGDHCVAVKSNGTMWSWGDGSYGALGLGSVTDYNTPQLIGTDTDWVAVKSEGAHNMALKADGSLHSWGEDTYGQLGVIFPNGNRPSVSPCPTLALESFAANEFEIYPNPVSTMLHITSNSSPAKSYRIYDIMGKVVKEDERDADQVDVTSLAPGVYYLKVQGEVTSIKKFIKQ